MGSDSKLKGAFVALVVVCVALVSAAPASAAHHLVRIRQVYPGSVANPNAEFVALQLTGAGENQFAFGGGSSVRLYSATGMETNTATFSSNAPNGENQRMVLVGTTAAATMFTGVPLDLQFTANTDTLANAGGAACFTSVTFGGVDCVGWGTLAFPVPPSPIGTPEGAIPVDQILERSIAANCPTLFETADDTNDSAADFFTSASFSVRNNNSAITEMDCFGEAVPVTLPATPIPASPPAVTMGPPLPKKKCKKVKHRSALAAKKCKKRK